MYPCFVTLTTIFCCASQKQLLPIWVVAEKTTLGFRNLAWTPSNSGADAGVDAGPEVVCRSCPRSRPWFCRLPDGGKSTSRRNCAMIPSGADVAEEEAAPMLRRRQAAAPSESTVAAPCGGHQVFHRRSTRGWFVALQNVLLQLSRLRGFTAHSIGRFRCLRSDGSGCDRFLDSDRLDDG